MSLSTIKDRLDASKPISSQLIPIMETALSVSTAILSVAKSAQGANDAALEKYKPQVATVLSDTQQLVTKANLILQQPGAVGSGPATPPTPPSTSNSAAVSTLTFFDSTCSRI